MGPVRERRKSAGLARARKVALAIISIRTEKDGETLLKAVPRLSYYTIKNRRSEEGGRGLRITPERNRVFTVKLYFPAKARFDPNTVINF